MATQVQFRRGTTTQNNAFTGAVGEITYDTDVKTLRLHDGTNSGGGAIVATLEATQTFQNKTHSTNSSWEGDAIGIAYGGTGNSLSAVAGAVAYGTSTGIALSLAGTSGQILSSGGTSSPTWINASSLTVGTATTATRASNIDGGSAGYLVYQVDTNDTGFIPPGSSGYVLVSTGASTAPSWSTPDFTLGTTAVSIGGTETDFTGIDTFDITGTTTSTSTTTGALTVAGGISTQENLNVGGVLNVTGATTLTDDLAVNGGDLTTTATTFNLLETNATTVNAFGAATTIDIGASTGTLTFNNAQTVFNSTDSIQIPVGTTAQRDGTPVAGQIRYNSTLSSFEGYGPGGAWGSLGGVIDVDQDTKLTTETSAGSDEDTFTFTAGGTETLTITNTAFDLKSGATMTVNNTTDASSSTTGALIIDGGVGIAKKLYVGTDADVGGNLQVDGSATVSTNLTVTGDLTVNGSTTTVDTTNLVVTDSLIELSNGATSATNDAGFIVERGSTGDNAAFVWDESAGGFRAGTTTATGASTGALTITNAPIYASNINASGTLAVTSTISAASGSTVGNLTLADGSITDSSGAISFGNENLSTTGNITGAIGTFASLDISGNADIDGTMEADAYTVNGTALNEYISDTVGAMVSSNTESGISVTYDDADNTLDFNVNDPTITISGDVAGSATMTNLGNVTISVAQQANSVDLATHTTGNYVATITGGTSIDVSGSGSENASVTINHADTSTLSGTYGSTDDGTKIDQITVDANGHVTGITTGPGFDRFIVEDGDGTEVVINRDNEWKFTEGGGVNINWTDTSNGSDSDPYDLQFTINTGITAGSGLTGGGTLNATRTISHADTSSQASVNNSGTTFIQDITLDGFGHITGINSASVSVSASGVGLGTTDDVQFDSLGIGTAASGTTGEIRATNTITAHYSDARLKKFEGTIDNALDKVLSLNGYYFRTNERAKEIGYVNENRQVGVSAQEVQAVLPEIIADAPINDVIPREQERDYKTVHYEKLVPLLIEAMKEQQKQIDELKKKLGE